MENFFREQSLVALRELALRQAAHEVEVRHETPKATDRLLIHVTSDPAAAMLIRRGRRVADYLRAECFAVYVSEMGDIRDLPPLKREAIDRHLNSPGISALRHESCRGGISRASLPNLRTGNTLLSCF